ncbi:MAG: DUF2797 domain-containing protein [Methanomassiliicoccales archaeon]
MFVRGDRLLKGGFECWHSLHALAYYWEGFRPRLAVYDVETESMQDLELVKELSRFEMSVEEERFCIGRFQEGRYVPCPDRARLDGPFAQCRSCASTWIPIQECIFEPKCAGDMCDSPLCRKEHVVYATFFGDVVKIGMTAGSRLVERSIEQGADAVAKLVRLPNRMEARKAEKHISALLGLPQRVRAETMANEVLKSPRPYELRAKHQEILSRLDGIYALLEDSLILLDGYPGLEELREVECAPAKVPPTGPHSGRLICIKGRYLFYESREKETLMLPLADVSSRHLELGHN